MPGGSSDTSDASGSRGDGSGRSDGPADGSESGASDDTGSGGPITPSFSGGVVNPFGLELVANGIDFTDIDGDGDADVFTTDGFGTRFFENTGSATSPSFAPGQDSPFGLVDKALGLDFVDIDDDGDKDGFSTNGFGTSWFENTGSPAAPSFAGGVQSPFGLEDEAGSLAIADIDGDGDLDVLTTDGFGTVFFENIGSAAEPGFGSAVNDPFGLVDEALGIELVDVDKDGDLDVFTCDGFGTSFFENTGTAAVPSFAGEVVDPFGLSDEALGLDFVDIDKDGDLDAFTTDGFETVFFENTAL